MSKFIAFLLIVIIIGSLISIYILKDSEILFITNDWQYLRIHVQDLEDHTIQTYNEHFNNLVKIDYNKENNIVYVKIKINHQIIFFVFDQDNVRIIPQYKK